MNTPLGKPGSSDFFDVRMRGFPTRTDVGDVIRLLDEHLACVAPLCFESIPLTQAAGRVLAQPVIAEVAVPGFARAAMDGYALRAVETFGATSYTPATVQVVGECLPGQSYSGSVLPGQAIRIMTGAPLPAGADAVLPVELGQEQAGLLRIQEPVSPGRHVARRGEDIEPGHTVLTQGRVLRPQDLGLLASLGVASIPVVRQPRVALFITGNELLPLGAKPHGYHIVDSNSIMLTSLLRRDCALVEGDPHAILPDDREALRQAIHTNPADLLLFSGGSSVGQEDHAPGLIAELGSLPIHGVALRPASPTGIGFLGPSRIVFLLPGNPVSCLCAYDLFAARAIRRLGGRSPELPYRRLQATLSNKISSALGRVDYVRVRLKPFGTSEETYAEPLAISGASLLSTTTIADGFVLVPQESEGFPAGANVWVYLYDRLE